MDVSAYVEIIRPINAVMAIIGTFLGHAIATHSFSLPFPLFLAMLAVLCIISAGQSINDFFDLDVDTKTGKKKPLVQGKIKRGHVFWFAIALFLIGVFIASMINFLAFAIAAFFAAMLFLYSAVMGKIKFFGNIIVALGVGFTFLFGASVATITPLVLMMALVAFLSNWAREIVKDVEDAEADKGLKLTLPHILSPTQTNIIIFGLLTLAILAAYLPILTGLGNLYYGILATITNLIFILAARQLVYRDPAKASALLKRGMLIGLIAPLTLV
ncbi:MAG: UbiA family prenyltransferase [Candidatus Diapherotrites archaeon]|nr:UbiA family prenyltransferase [Candidatus Diapherotrites archaeon]